MNRLQAIALRQGDCIDLKNVGRVRIRTISFHRGMIYRAEARAVSARAHRIIGHHLVVFDRTSEVIRRASA